MLSGAPQPFPHLSFAWWATADSVVHVLNTFIGGPLLSPPSGQHSCEWSLPEGTLEGVTVCQGSPPSMMSFQGHLTCFSWWLSPFSTALSHCYCPCFLDIQVVAPLSCCAYMCPCISLNVCAHLWHCGALNHEVPRFSFHTFPSLCRCLWVCAPSGKCSYLVHCLLCLLGNCPQF